jgi:hypothetical protein
MNPLRWLLRRFRRRHGAQAQIAPPPLLVHSSAPPPLAARWRALADLRPKLTLDAASFATITIDLHVSAHRTGPRCSIECRACVEALDLADWGWHCPACGMDLTRAEVHDLVVRSAGVLLDFSEGAARQHSSPSGEPR